MKQILKSVANRLGAFRREESGGLTIYLLPFFLFMLALTEVGLNLAHREIKRASILDLADRCTLAAASLTQKQADPETICREYAKSTPFGDELDIQVAVGGSGLVREVETGINQAHETYLLSLFGAPRLDIGVLSAAREGGAARRGIEISLILDISGSMARENAVGIGSVPRRRLDIMRDAAKDYVEDMLGGAGQENTTISLIPFAGQVNAGPFFELMLDGSATHDYSKCVELDQDTFYDTVDLPEQNSLTQVPHFQNFSFERLNGQTALPFDPNGGNEAEWGWCPGNALGIVPFTNDPQVLKDAIDAIVGHDGTGSQIGMKWGLGLLSDATQPMIAALASKTNPETGQPFVDPAYADRPGPFRVDDENGPDKIIVFMSDGRVRYQNRPRPEEYAKDPEAWAFSEDSVALGRTGLFATNRTGRSANLPLTTLPTRAMRDESELEARNQFLDLCQAAAENGVQIYTIAFGFETDNETAKNAKQMMSDCADKATDLNVTGDFLNAPGEKELNNALNFVQGEIQALQLYK